MTSQDGNAAIREREFNVRLHAQYAAMLWLVWMGATFEGEALTRWNRLRTVFA